MRETLNCRARTEVPCFAVVEGAIAAGEGGQVHVVLEVGPDATGRGMRNGKVVLEPIEQLFDKTGHTPTNGLASSRRC